MVVKYRSMMLLLEKHEILIPSDRVNEKWSFPFSFLPNQKLNPFSISSNFKLNTQIKDYHPAASASITKSTTSITNSNQRILIVDDEQDITRLFKVALERAGFIVNVYDDPLESLSNYKAGLYDLLLLDIKMPQMSGFELYNKIKEIDDKVKVCFITAFEEYYDEFKKLFPHLKEAECYIRKPVGMEVGMEDLVRIVKSHLNSN
jgi:CheY-like chemotaxis protein